MMRKKRPKVLELLLNTNWSKTSQQTANLSKLNRLLSTQSSDDLNQLLDEKSGQTALSLIVSSPQINFNHIQSQCQDSLLSSNSNQSLLSQSSSSSILSNHSNQLNANQSTISQLFHHDPHQQQQQQQLASSLAACQTQQGSLFAVQCQSTGLSLNQLQATSAADLIASKGPLVERILQLMVKAGARLDMRNTDGKTPLHVAASKSNFWALKTLLDLGAISDPRDENGLTPLYYSILDRAELKVTQLLLSHQCVQVDKPIGLRDQHGWHEVHHACKLGLDTHLEKLLYYGCDINSKIDGSGNTPLHVAAINDQINCAKVLLLRGADKNITNSSHQTAHQVAVIAGNMDLAEFISEYSPSQVIPFKDKPTDFIRGFGAISRINQKHHNEQPKTTPDQYLSRQLSTRSVLVSSQSSFHLGNNSNFNTNSQPIQNTASYFNQFSQRYQTLQPNNNQQLQMQSQSKQQLQQHDQSVMSPLSLESLINNDTLDQFPTTRTNLSSNRQSMSSVSHNTKSLAGSMSSCLSATILPISIDQLGELSNVSPCLSQRSFATSNTTSSSGVCMDGDGTGSANEDSNASGSTGGSLNRRSTQLGSSMNQSISQHSNITVISIKQKPSPVLSQLLNTANTDVNNLGHDHRDTVNSENCDYRGDDSSHSSSSTESCNDLYSLMLDERPLVAGNIVEAVSDYHSGDPSHLELHRGDLIEILDCSESDLLNHGGMLPRMANKPMLFGKLRHVPSSTGGLFPSFCIRRTKLHSHRSNENQRTLKASKPVEKNLPNHKRIINSIVESQSLVSLDRFSSLMDSNQTDECNNLKFREFQVTLTKTSNEGFGFVLRGAKIDPTSLSSAITDVSNTDESIHDASGQCTTTSVGSRRFSISINDDLMKKNNLASLQYLDEIEPNSVADKVGLRRGDFLVAVNNHDVRLESHEQVVRMIRESGTQVHLTIASPQLNQNQQHQDQKQQQHQVESNSMVIAPTYASSRTLGRIKPEPPKRDPTTTLSRSNKSQKQNISANQVRSITTPPASTTSGQEQQDKTHPTTRVITEAARCRPEDSHSLASTLSLHNTPTHSSSSGSTQTTIEANTVISLSQTISSGRQEYSGINGPSMTAKPNLPLKPNISKTTSSPINANVHQSLQTIYQPAVITTTTRRRLSNTSGPTNSQNNNLNDGFNKTNDHGTPVMNLNIRKPDVSKQIVSQCPISPPPPPPPLPDFSPIKISQPNRVSKNADTNNRRSVQLDIAQGIAGLKLDAESLQRRRASLVSVNTIPVNNSNTLQMGAKAGATVAPELKSVAAACAAAANNRIQRQSQQHQQMASRNGDMRASLQIHPQNQLNNQVLQNLHIAPKSYNQFQQTGLQHVAHHPVQQNNQPQVPSHQHIHGPAVHLNNMQHHQHQQNHHLANNIPFNGAQFNQLHIQNHPTQQQMNHQQHQQQQQHHLNLLLANQQYKQHHAAYHDHQLNQLQNQSHQLSQQHQARYQQHPLLQQQHQQQHQHRCQHAPSMVYQG